MTYIDLASTYSPPARTTRWARCGSGLSTDEQAAIEAVLAGEA
jgi:hypothetical protein